MAVTTPAYPNRGGPDVPAGLESIFNPLLSYTFGLTSLGYRFSPSSASANRRMSWISRSLFVLWEPIWDGFAGPRRAAWTAYWETLPFGSHSGAGGWPGTGYSAFVYVNAPRKRAGLDLLLDPPGLELIFNGNFDGNSDGWSLVNFEYGDHDLRHIGVLDYSNADSSFFFLENLASYRLRWTCESDGDDNSIFSLDEGLNVGFSFSFGVTDGLQSFDEVVENTGGSSGDFFLRILLRPTLTGRVTQISCVKV